MHTIVDITDDFDLEKIRLSGQIFRMNKLKPDSKTAYTLITQDRILEIQKKSELEYCVSCDQDEFQEVWYPYFDLSRNYAEIREIFEGENVFLDSALNFGRGLRILRQDPWEMIVTFIISQRRSMPAIATAVDKLCSQFGEDCGDFKAFPSPEKLCSLKENDIRSCGVGYRAPYILDAARRVVSGELSLKACSDMHDEELFNKLCEIKGVGTKVANCIMLFGFGRTSRAPVDVWIQRVIDEKFGGTNPFPSYGTCAGILQQYMFYWRTQHK